MSLPERMHFIAVGGAGMSALAMVCSERGVTVSGSDRAESAYLRRVRDAGVTVYIGHDADQVPGDATVVVSTAIPEDNPELLRARELGLRVLHRGELLAEICAERRLIAVAGAHGKTTTSGMIAHVLRAAGGEPSFLLGGDLPGEGGATNAAWGSSEWIVAEADESDGSFLRLRPAVAAITNVELDHHSHWGGERELVRAFAEFSAPAEAVIRPAEESLASLDGAGRVLTFAVGPGPGRRRPAALLATDVQHVDGGMDFTLAGAVVGGEHRVRLSVPGLHNVVDATVALGALAAARELGPGADALPPLEELIAALASFPGMARRLELKGSVGGARVYDDYAHHPTEVAASLAALRPLVPDGGRLVALFQPHLYSRTKALATRFGRALALADVVAVLDVYAAREQPVGALEGVSGLQVARAVADAAPGRDVIWAREADAAVGLLPGLLRDGDVLVTIGAGDVFGVGERLLAEVGSG